MRDLSVCSGIEAATVAWHPLGWEAAAFAEIEAFPRAVLKHHYPNVPLHGDFTTIKGDEYGSIDLLVGGTPCQSFSIAGLRGGLADDRGNLALEFLRLADRTRAKWLVWENVPGVLSSNGGRDFGSILGGLGELRYGWAYRIVDAQHFGIPQRRRRVFVVGYLGDWRRAAAVLFERHSLQGHSPPRRDAGKGIAPTIASRPTGGGGLGTDFDCDGGLIAGSLLHNGTAAGSATSQDAYNGMLIANPLRAQAQHSHRADSDNVVVAMCLSAHRNRLDAQSQTLLAFDTTQVTSRTNRSQPQFGDPCHTMAKGAQAPAIAFQSRASASNGMTPASTSPSLDVGKSGGMATNVGGFGEFDVAPNVGPYQDPTPTHAELCPACGGTGRDCVSTSAAGIDDYLG